MALLDLKSTSKKGATPISSSSSSKNEKFPNRRSRSVSAVSRTHSSVPSSSSSSDLADSFLNKRDNPLFCCSSSSSSSNSPDSQTPAASSSKDGRAGRGRPVSRGSGSQSSSTMDTGRRRLRSVSREHFGNLETDMENRYKSTSSLESKEDDKSFASRSYRNTSVTATEFDGKRQTRNLPTWTSQHPALESCDVSLSCFQAGNWGDKISTSSFSEAEEAISSEFLQTFQRDNLAVDLGSDAIYQTVRSEVLRAVSEIRDDIENAIWRKKPGIHHTAGIGDIPSEFASIHELDSDFRREYVSMLEQTQERARKLRADLAVEEQRAQELNRILQETIHISRNPDPHKCHQKRKSSAEHRRTSRSLAEEALNYFDECVSISTFDCSDLSSFEDPRPSLVEEVSTHSVSDFADVGTENVGADDLRQYIKKFEKPRESLEQLNARPSYCPYDYELSANADGFFCDSLILRSRIESGGLLLCDIRIFS